MAALAIIALVAIGAVGPGIVWEYGVMRPMINGLILLSRVFLGSFGLAIIVFTVLLRVVSFPLTISQLRASKALSTLTPLMQEIQKKYKDPKRRQEETMKLYRQAGINPLGCLFPMLIQFPIWIALYRVIILTLGNVPERLLELSQRLYPLSFIQDALPLNDRFLGMNLGKVHQLQDPVGLSLAALVGISMYVQQKMMTPTTSADPRTQSMNRTMQWMMPLMFAWFTSTVPSGLALYWVATNVIGIGLSAAFVYGWEGLHWRRLLLPEPSPAASGAATRPPAALPSPTEAASQVEEEKRAAYGRVRGKRKNRRRGRRQGPPTARTRPIPGSGGGDQRG